MKIQVKDSTQTQTRSEATDTFESGYKYLVGVTFVPLSNSTYGAKSTFELKVDGEVVLPYNFPASLLQSSQAVPVNERFFTLFNKVSITGKKYEVNVERDGTVEPVRFLFLLSNE